MGVFVYNKEYQHHPCRLTILLLVPQRFHCPTNLIYSAFIIKKNLYFQKDNSHKYLAFNKHNLVYAALFQLSWNLLQENLLHQVQRWALFSYFHNGVQRCMILFTAYLNKTAEGDILGLFFSLGVYKFP